MIEHFALRKKKEKARERERERAREKELDHPKSRKPREGPPHKISNLLVLDPKEREISSKTITHSYRVLPGSHDNL